jgi:hypothetical protein
VFDEPSPGPNDLLESLFEMAQPLLFRANAFRIVGLLTNASESAIRKQAEKLQFQARHGGNAEATIGPLPLEPEPVIEVVLEAMQRLHDPERRFLEEFFWFWPQANLGSNDQAIDALSKRDVEAAAEIWSGQSSRADDDGRASHNLAVMFHTLALDVEYARQSEAASAKLRNVQYSYWEKGLSQWQAVLSDERFWNTLNERVVELNDPRLTSDTIRQLRLSLPVTLLLISAQLAASATERGAIVEAQQYLRLIQQCGFAGEVVQEAVGRAALQIRQQISAMCKAAEHDAVAHPATADEGVRRLLVRSSSLLTAIDVLLVDSAIRNEARDEVAVTVTDCLLLYLEAAGSWKIALELLDLTRPCAVSLAVRERIDYLRAQFLRYAYRTGDACSHDRETNL